MANVKVVLSPDPTYLDTKTYDAKADRKRLWDFASPGPIGSTAFKTSLTSGMAISVAGGVAYIKGGNIADQGMYRQYVAAATAMTVPTSDPTNPRIDQVILRVLDNAADAGTFNEARLEIIGGTPTAGATLANRSGAANLNTLFDASKSYILLTDILIPAGAIALIAGNVADRRVTANSALAGRLDTTASLPSATGLPDGIFSFVSDAVGGVNGRLFMTVNGAWNAVAPHRAFTIAVEHWDYTLPASTLMVQADPANAATRVYDIDNAGFMNVPPSLDTTITVPAGVGSNAYLIYGKHETNIAGDFGMMLNKNNTTMLSGGNKTAKFGNAADSLPYKSDKIVAMCVVTLAVGDQIDMQAWHSAGGTDHFEMGIVRLPLN